MKKIGSLAASITDISARYTVFFDGTSYKVVDMRRHNTVVAQGNASTEDAAMWNAAATLATKLKET